MKKHRIGIFVLFDKNGIVEDYATFLLNSIRILVDKLVIGVNGSLAENEIEKLAKISDDVYFRENIGYDGGAYQDIILNYLSDQEIQQYEEMILFNDSFYGPFYGWEYIFRQFEQIDVDFWGLSKWIYGPSSREEVPYLPEHIQSYFIVIRENMLKSKCFKDFWIHMHVPDSYDEAILNFEVGFTQYFKDKGFKYTSWIDLMKGNKYLKSGEVVYITHAGDLVENCKFPIMKRKIISFFNITQYKKVVDYVKKYYEYDVTLIYRLFEEYEKNEFPYKNIEDFYMSHKRVYVFGYGKWGQNLEAYFNYKHWKIESFIVSSQENNKDGIMSLDQLKMEQEDGLIVALGVELCKKVVPALKKKYANRDILVPSMYVG